MKNIVLIILLAIVGLLYGCTSGGYVYTSNDPYPSYYHNTHYPPSPAIYGPVYPQQYLYQDYGGVYHNNYGNYGYPGHQGPRHHGH